MSLTQSAFKLAYEISPIILVGGIAQAIPGNMLPIVAITESLNFAQGLLQGQFDINLDQYFAHFRVMPGGTLINNQIGEYPFANQTVAANAIIAQPLNVSLEMTCPAKGDLGYVTKILKITALKQALDAHNQAGGLYNVLTPSYIYTNCVLPQLRDMSTGDSKQVQTRWVFDFHRPLIAVDEAGTVYNNLMNIINQQTKIQGPPTWSGLANTVGTKISTTATSALNSVKGFIGVSP